MDTRRESRRGKHICLRHAGSASGMTSSHTSISHAPNCYRHATVVSAQNDRGFAAETSRRRRVTTPPLPRSLKAQIRVTKGGISAQRLQRTAVRHKLACIVPPTGFSVLPLNQRQIYSRIHCSPAFKITGTREGSLRLLHHFLIPRRFIKPSFLCSASTPTPPQVHNRQHSRSLLLSPGTRVPTIQ